MIIILHTPSGQIVDKMIFNADISNDPAQVWEKNIGNYMKEFRKKNKYAVTKIECQSEKNGLVMYTKDYTQP